MTRQNKEKSADLKLFLCGDVMTGRGIDQALLNSVEPVLYEPYIKDAGAYLRLAENKNGPVDIPVSYDYIWGDALKVWDENAPDLKLINLETCITTSAEPWPGKGINYRMHPENVKVLTAAGIDHCSLANNHILDWGIQGLKETMQTLDNAGINFSGAGNNEFEAREPALLETDNGRVLVYSYGSPDSGIPLTWTAENGMPGVNILPDFGEKEIRYIKHNIESQKKKGDIVIFSIHWGGNWGYKISAEYKKFARHLIDNAGVDVIFGHSSHHPLGIELYSEKLIIYGAGDFINDYEGISGHERYRSDLTLMYFPLIDIRNGQLKSLKMVPMKIKRFQLKRADKKDAIWLQKMLNMESSQNGTITYMDNEKTLVTHF
jgi:poly-gamma-glutamate capsule biosynthesis protein CapA/YwtB (metallophosphatase superfamily)